MQIIIRGFKKKKRNVCDKIIVFLASLIHKCSKKEELIKHLNSIDENKENSAKFKKIDSKKDELFHAINDLKNANLNLYNYNSELHVAFEMVNKLLDKNEVKKAKDICIAVKENLNNKD